MKGGVARLILIIIVLHVLLLSGCTSFGSGKYRDANVSDAMRQAAGKPVVVPRAERKPERGWGYDSSVSASVSSETHYSDHTSDYVANSAKFGVEYMRVRYQSSSLTEGRFYSLYVEFHDKSSQAVGTSVTFGNYDLPTTGTVGDSISSVYSFSWDVFTKFYGPDISFIAAPYALFSVGYGTLAWDYRQPITDSSGYTFSSDSLEYMEFKTGLGGELGRYGALQISAYIGPVARVYLWRTTEGFNNDVFEDRLDMTWSGMIGIGF